MIEISANVSHFYHASLLLNHRFLSPKSISIRRENHCCCDNKKKDALSCHARQVSNNTWKKSVWNNQNLGNWMKEKEGKEMQVKSHGMRLTSRSDTRKWIEDKRTSTNITDHLLILGWRRNKKSFLSKHQYHSRDKTDKGQCNWITYQSF